MVIIARQKSSNSHIKKQSSSNNEQNSRKNKQKSSINKQVIATSNLFSMKKEENVQWYRNLKLEVVLASTNALPPFMHKYQTPLCII